MLICGGHAGRAHKKQLEKLSKMKRYSPTLIKKYSKLFLSVGNVVSHCSRHSSRCGCRIDKFIERVRNNFLSKSESAEEFAIKMRALPRHAHDEHKWNEGRCNFHLP